MSALVWGKLPIDSHGGYRYIPMALQGGNQSVFPAKRVESVDFGFWYTYITDRSLRESQRRRSSRIKICNLSRYLLVSFQIIVLTFVA